MTELCLLLSTITTLKPLTISCTDRFSISHNMTSFKAEGTCVSHLFLPDLEKSLHVYDERKVEK